MAITRFSYSQLPKALLTTFCCALLLSACSDEQADSNAMIEHPQQREEQATSTEPSLNINHSPEMERLLATIDQQYNLTALSAESLNDALLSFAKLPKQSGLDDVIDKLSNLHAVYSGLALIGKCCKAIPLKTSKQDPEISSIPIPVKLDQHPLLPGYLDSVEGYPLSGIIHSDIPISRETMLKEFQLGDPAYVPLGFHALETLLKGGSGNRKITDFSPIKSTRDSSDASPELRRTLYIILLGAEIQHDIETLKSNWLLETRPKLNQMDSAQTSIFFKQLDKYLETRLASLSEPASDDHFSAKERDKQKAFLDQLRSLDDNE
ncbi:MAG: imelysin family protein [Oleiphilus sp.]